jgi:DNA-directed RNA polymerase specialized sigma24 family protein
MSISPERWCDPKKSGSPDAFPLAGSLIPHGCFLSNGSTIMLLLATEVREMLEELTQEQFSKLRKRVGFYYYSRYLNEPRLDFDDLFQRSFLSMLDGSRHWDPERADLATFLRGALRSIASHDLRKMNRTPVDLLEDEVLMPAAQENDLVAKLVWEEILELVSDDWLLRRMVEFRSADPQIMPRDMVALLPEVSSETVRAGWRRLRELIKRLEGTGGLI